MTNSTAERIAALMAAPPETLARIDAILAGGTEPAPICKLLDFKTAAQRIGVSRTTIWRLVRAGRIHSVEIREGRHRVAETELARLVAGVTTGGR